MEVRSPYRLIRISQLDRVNDEYLMVVITTSRDPDFIFRIYFAKLTEGWDLTEGGF